MMLQVMTCDVCGVYPWFVLTMCYVCGGYAPGVCHTVQFYIPFACGLHSR